MQIENLNKNHVIVTEGTKRTLFSYGTAVAQVEDTDGQVTLDEANWDYSATTSKFRNQFLADTTPNTRKKIDAGIYKLDDLNQ